MGEDITTVLRTTWNSFIGAVVALLPKLVSLLALVLVGWLAAFVVRAVTRAVLRWIRFDSLLERVGLTASLARLGAPAPHVVLASIFFWVVWLTFLLSGLNALGFVAAQQLSADLLRFIPRVVVALAVLLVGYAVANFLWRAVLLATVNAHVRQAKLLAAMARWITLIAAFAMALEQLQIGERVMYTVFALLTGAVCLGGAIAFGLGGRHIARRYLEERLLSREPQRPQDESVEQHL
jgi:hypothetical protein